MFMCLNNVHNVKTYYLFYSIQFLSKRIFHMQQDFQKCNFFLNFSDGKQILKH